MARFNSTFENALIAWVKAALGSSFTVFWDKQDFPTPSIPYATIGYLSAGNIENLTPDKINNNDVAKTTTLLTYETLTISVNVFDNSNDYLNKISKLKRSFFDSVINNNLNKAGLYYRNASNTTDLSELQETSYEFRAQADFVFAYTNSSTETDSGYITRVSGEVLDIDFDADNTPT